MSLLAIFLLVANVAPFPMLNQKMTDPSSWVGPSGHSFDYGRQILSLYSSALTPALLKYLISIGRNPDPVVNVGNLVKREFRESCLGTGGGAFSGLLESLGSEENDEDPPR